MSEHWMPMQWYVLSIATLTAAKPSGMLAPGIMFDLTVVAAAASQLSICGSSAAANAYASAHASSPSFSAAGSHL